MKIIEKARGWIEAGIHKSDYNDEAEKQKFTS